jgi:fumarate reductase iron-sulfur subunit
VYTINPDFIGPFALTRAWRYVNDAREEKCDDKIAAVQVNGIWDCTLCGECVPVCPQGIAPAQDIRMLRTKSGVMGHMDPSMANMFSGGLDFGSPTF